MARMSPNWSVSSLAVLMGLASAACDSSDDDARIGPRHRSSPALTAFQTCDELGRELRANLKEEMRVQLLQQLEGGGYWRNGPIMEDAADAAAGGAPPESGGRQEGVDYSGTNNQETGVDEADFVKTDGYYIYVLNGKRLEILGVPNFGELTHVSTTELEGYPTALLLSGDRAAVFSQIYTYQLPADHPIQALTTDEASSGYRSTDLVKVTILDLTDRANPAPLRELYLEGYFQTARKIDTSVRLLAYSWMNIYGLEYYPQLPDSYYRLPYDSDEAQEIYREAIHRTIARNDSVIANLSLDALVPKVLERTAAGAILQHLFTSGSCSNFAIAEDGVSRGFTSILSFDLLGVESAFESDHIVSNHSTIYASTDTLVIAEPAQDWWWFWMNDELDEATNLHRFDIGSPGVTVYTGSGRVDGTVLGQFALSEHEDYIRVASTTGRWGRWWLQDPPPPENHVFVLAGTDALGVVGHVGGIAVGEQLWAARFVGDEAYLVTFRNIDPLFTIDMSDPTNPRVIGELEVPGVSTYIHPLEGDHLLTIGYGGDDDGLDWSSQISLFDVTDFADPQLASALPLAPPSGNGWTWSWSEANWEHKAFQYWAPKSMLAVPLSTYRSVNAGNGYYEYEYYSRLQLVRVDVATGLSLYGSIDHSGFFNSDPDTWWAYRDVRRSIFMGDYIYAISDRGVTAHKLDDLSPSASLQLTGSIQETYWWY